MANVHAVVSRPGPVEAGILAELEGGAPAFAVHRQAAGGVTLRYLEGGSGPPLVLLHGRGGAATSWFPLLPGLGQVRRVVAVDLPGFGHSAWGPFQSRAHRAGAGAARGEAFAEGLGFFADPVEALLLELGLGGAPIVGHSLGGLVAVELALRGRLRPPKLGLIGAMGLGPEMSYASRAYFRAGPERLARRLGAALFTRLHPSSADAGGAGPHAARGAALYHELCAVRGGRPEAAAAFNAMTLATGPAPNLGDRLGEIEAEALVLWGERDEVFPSPTAIAAAAAIPRAELRILPCGHAPHLDAPAEVQRILLDFLERRG